MIAETLQVNKATGTLDKETVVHIYELYSPAIFKYAFRMLNDHDLAEDCVADTFHRLLVAVRSGTSFDNVRAYLYRIAHNWITDYYRRQPPPAVALEEELHPDTDNNPSHLVMQNIDRQRVRQALLKLSAEQRMVIELRFMENWTHSEVAEALGKSVDATRALQYRAVEALRDALSESS